MVTARPDSTATTLCGDYPSPLGDSSSAEWRDQDEYPSNNPLVHDTEKIPDVVRQELSRHGLNVTEEGVVYWADGAWDFPRNWSIRRKTYDTFIVVFFELIATLFSNTGTSAAEHALEQFHISKELSIFCFTTLYLLAQALGSIILPPYTESFGRRPSHVLSCATYCVCCIIVAASNHLAGVVVGRFFSGFVSAVPGTVATGSLEDLWDTRARIWVYNLWTMAAIIGLGLGPVVATSLGSSKLGWEWTFWIAAIITGGTTAMAYFVRESRASQTLKLKILHVRKANKERTFPHLTYEGQEQAPSPKTFATTCLIRPAWLFVTEPIILTVTMLNALVYATIYIFTEAIQVVYTDFNFTKRQSSLVNLAFSIGPLFSILTRLYDVHISVKRTKRNTPVMPEDKLFGFYVAAPLLALASWWFAWTIPPAVTTISPFVSMSSLIFVGFAANEFDYVLCGYLTDTYTSWASSANAPLAFMRAALSGVFPLFGAQMFESIGGNRAESAMAVVATAYCVVAVGFWKFGRKIREKSKAASF